MLATFFLEECEKSSRRGPALGGRGETGGTGGTGGGEVGDGERGGGRWGEALGSGGQARTAAVRLTPFSRISFSHAAPRSPTPLAPVES